MTPAVLMLFALALCGASPAWGAGEAAVAPEVRRAIVEATRIRVQRTDGSWASGRDLVGAVIVAADESGIRERFRIDGVETYTTEATGEILLYTLSVYDPATGTWRHFCRPDAQGRRVGFPLSGYWDEAGRHVPSKDEFSLTCTSGTIGKCVLFGYLPWKTRPEGTPLWAYHQACTRLLRADYCGNGRPHTRDGTLVEIFDREGIQVDTATGGLSFEAAWDGDGAVCVRKTRIPEIATLEDILAECPEKLRGRTGEEACRENFGDPGVLILNRSPIDLNP